MTSVQELIEKYQDSLFISFMAKIVKKGETGYDVLPLIKDFEVEIKDVPVLNFKELQFGYKQDDIVLCGTTKNAWDKDFYVEDDTTHDLAGLYIIGSLGFGEVTVADDSIDIKGTAGIDIKAEGSGRIGISKDTDTLLAELNSLKARGDSLVRQHISLVS